MDLLLMRFTEARLDAMSDADLALYDALLRENDQDLYQWIAGQAAPPEVTPSSWPHRVGPGDRSSPPPARPEAGQNSSHFKGLWGCLTQFSAFSPYHLIRAGMHGVEYEFAQPPAKRAEQKGFMAGYLDTLAWWNVCTGFCWT
jgi:hypothetical protein